MFLFVRFKRIVGFTILLMVLVGSTAWADVIYVDNSVAGLNDGSSWEDAFTSLESALVAATTGDELWVARGTYTPSAIKTGDDDPRGAAFQLKNGVAVYGGFSGEETVREDRDWESHTTIISGERGAADDDTDNCYHVFYHPSDLALDNTAVLDGVEISGGSAYSDDVDAVWHMLQGGGMYNEASSPVIRNCTLTGNFAGMCGAGVYNMSASPLIENCDFSQNISLFGGGVCNESSQSVITGSAFTDNIAFGIIGDGTGWGGAVYNQSSSLILTNCGFENNGAIFGGAVTDFESTSDILSCDFIENEAAYGGALCISGSSDSTVTDCEITNNAAIGNWDEGTGKGGGVYCEASSSIFTRCTFKKNDALSAGGMGNGPSSSSTVRECYFLGNTGVMGGGVVNGGADALFVNALFVGNRAETGGGFLNVASSVNLTNCTISSNEAYSGDEIGPEETGRGGGMMNIDATVTIVNCILWEDRAAVEGEEELANISEVDETEVTISHSDMQGAFSDDMDWNSDLGKDNGGNIVIDPEFVDPPTPGRDEIWGTDDDRFGDLDLRVMSSCIDAGDNHADNVPEIDIDGNDRVDGVDMGAYDYQPLPSGDANIDLSSDVRMPHASRDTAGSGCFLSTICFDGFVKSPISLLRCISRHVTYD
ncbi:MAG: choice-of-anchor Q domain-containing protein [Thermodesulfobacteriota bacterium]|nr:choice-of-anchor Q domain-containing protein [Thermodesulfobacteriota bacterium]